jgi:hypothetical protein
VLAHPLDPSPGGVMVVRARVPFDNLDQVGAFGVGQRVLLRPRQEMKRGIVGGLPTRGLGFGRVRGRNDMPREIAIERPKESPATGVPGGPPPPPVRGPCVGARSA